MGKFIKHCIPLIIAMLVFIFVVKYTQNMTVAIAALFVYIVVLIMTLRKVRKNRKKYTTKRRNTYSGNRNTTSSGSGEWSELYNLASLYSGWQNLVDYAKVEFVVTFDDSYGYVYTINGYLDLSDCDDDVNANDVRASLQNAIKRLQSNILSDATSITNDRVTVSVGNFQ